MIYKIATYILSFSIGLPNGYLIQSTKFKRKRIRYLAIFINILVSLYLIYFKEYFNLFSLIGGLLFGRKIFIKKLMRVNHKISSFNPNMV